MAHISDEEVRPVEVTTTIDASAPVIDIKDFQKEVVVVDLALVDEPKMPSRLVSAAHVSTLKASLRRAGYEPSSGMLGVSLRAEGGSSAVVDVPGGMKRVEGRCFLIDGRHRLHALRELAREDAAFEKGVKELEVMLWKCSDGRCLSSLQILSLSSYLNQATGSVLRTSFKDNVHAAVSTARIVALEKGVAVETVGKRYLAGVLQSARTIAAEIRQLQRYAQLAMVLASEEELYKVFFETYDGLDAQGVKLGLAHFMCSTFLDLESEGFKFCLAVVRYRLEAKVGGDFAAVRTDFFKCAKLQYLTLKRAARESGMSFEEVLNVQISFGGSKRTTALGEIICKRLSKFGASENVEAAIKQRLVRLGEALRKAGLNVSPVGSEGQAAEAVEVPMESQGSRRGKGMEVEEECVAETPVQPSQQPIRETPEVSEEEDGITPALPKASAEVKKKTAVVKMRALRRMKRKIPSYYEGADSTSSSSSPRTEGRAGGKGRAPEPSLSSRKKRKVAGKKAGGVEGAIEVLKGLDPSQLQKAVHEVGLEVLPGVEEVVGEEDSSSDEFEDAGGRGFDDAMPSSLPVGYEEPERYEGEANPSWARYATIPPSQWPDYNPIKHAQPFLEYIHIPHDHRANVVHPSPIDLANNHHCVYLHAAHNYYEKHGVWPGLVTEELRKSSPRAMKWAAVLQRDEVALDYFAEQRTLLKERGYCILENLMKDGILADGIGGVAYDLVDRTDWLLRVRDHFQALLKEDPEEQRKSRVWKAIVNLGFEADMKGGLKGSGRFGTTLEGLLECENDEKETWLVRDKAKIDIRLGQCAASLQLWPHSDHVKDPMFVPSSGGRWLASTKGCERQTLHTDFPTLGSEDLQNGKNPGYFMMCAPTEVILWVCEHSHSAVSMARGRKRKLSGLSHGMEVVPIKIPPYSVFVGRGDMFHAGAGYDDYITKGTNVRYHMYLVPDKVKLLDAIHLDSTFTPEFRTLESDGLELGDRGIGRQPATQQ